MLVPRIAGKRSAFTLIELLVVVAIIALLISILLPSLNRAREQARSTACMANLKQISAGAHIYATEHEGHFPPERYSNPDRTSYRTWRKILAEDSGLSTPEIWLCTEDQPPETYPGDGNSEPGVGQVVGQTVQDVASNYVVNGRMFAGWLGMDYTDRRAPVAPMTVNIRQPSRKIHMLEAQTWWADTWYQRYDREWLPYWHMQGGNWAMADGHVEWMLASDTVAPCMWHNDSHSHETVKQLMKATRAYDGRP